MTDSELYRARRGVRLASLARVPLNAEAAMAAERFWWQSPKMGGMCCLVCGSSSSKHTYAWRPGSAFVRLVNCHRVRWKSSKKDGASIPWHVIVARF